MCQVYHKHYAQLSQFTIHCVCVCVPMCMCLHLDILGYVCIEVNLKWCSSGNTSPFFLSQGFAFSWLSVRLGWLDTNPQGLSCPLLLFSPPQGWNYMSAPLSQTFLCKFSELNPGSCAYSWALASLYCIILTYLIFVLSGACRKSPILT